MIIESHGWKFDVDLTCTMAYSAAEAAEHCTCGYCRNFYAAVDSVYPQLRLFLAEFGIDIEAPDELMPFEIGAQMVFDCTYAVCGRIIKEGETNILLNGLSVCFTAENTYSVNHCCPEPNFFITVSDAQLPWVLEEPAQEVLSTANEDPFMRRMTDRIFDKNGSGLIT